MNLNINGNLILVTSVIAALNDALDITINVDGDVLIIDDQSLISEAVTEASEASEATEAEQQPATEPAPEPWHNFDRQNLNWNDLPSPGDEIELLNLYDQTLIGEVERIDRDDRYQPMRVRWPGGFGTWIAIRGYKAWRPHRHPANAGDWTVSASGSVTLDSESEVAGYCGAPRSDSTMRIDWSVDLTGRTLGENNYILDTEEIKRYFARQGRPKMSAEQFGRKAARDLYDLAAAKGIELKKAAVKISGVDDGAVTYTWPIPGPSRASTASPVSHHPRITSRP